MGAVHSPQHNVRRQMSAGNLGTGYTVRAAGISCPAVASSQRDLPFSNGVIPPAPLGAVAARPALLHHRQASPPPPAHVQRQASPVPTLHRHASSPIRLRSLSPKRETLLSL